MNSSNNYLKITPIGGVGQIGSNMTLIESANESIIIDVGMLFPREQGLGVNYLIPDFYEINKEKISSIFITHCHEDHIGALKQFTEFCPGKKIYTEKFTKSIIVNKYGNLEASFEVISSESTIEFQDFTVSSFRVNHSTAQTLGFVVKDKKNALIYTSDFRVDTNLTVEKTFDFDRVNKLTDGSNKKVAFIDSTNILSESKTMEESDLRENLESLLNKNQRIFLTMFASNIYRFLAILEICKKLKKKPVLYGRSIHFYFQCGLEAGIIPEDFAKTADIENVDLNRDDLVILTSGCQGNFKSTLSSLARGSSMVKIRKNDLVIFSSSVIPGNMKQIQHVYNLFIEAGADVITSKDLPIHCSGHPGKEDLRLVYNKLNLTDIAPIHGESYFIKRHCDFIKSEFPKISAHHMANHCSLIIDDEIKFEAHDPKDLILISDNNKVIERESVSQRRKIAEKGLIIVSVVDYKRVDIKTFGLNLSRELHIKMANYVSDQVKRKQSSEKIRIGARKIYSNSEGHKPVIDIIDFR